MRFFCFCVLGMLIAVTGFGQDSLSVSEELLITVAYEYDQWEDFRSYEGRFRVLMPGEVIENTQLMEMPIGEVRFHTFYCELKDPGADNLVYILSYCDYPEGGMHSDSTQLLADFFDATLEGAAESVTGKVIYSQDHSYKNYPGRVWRIDYLEGKAVIKTRAFMVGQRFYSLQTITTKERSLNNSTEKFFESFRLFDGG